MRRFLIVRGLQAVATLVAIVVMVFVGLRLAPGDPARLFLPEGATEEQIDELNREWGLKEPLHVQLFLYSKNLLKGDMGDSFSYGRPAAQVVLDRLPNTIQLAALAFGLATVVSIPLGILSATRRGSWLDNSIMGGALALQAMPQFWLALQLILLFSLVLGVLPSSGKEDWRHIILPAVALSSQSLAGLIRILRVELVRVLASDYIRTAHAKGLKDRAVLWRHAVKNASIPVVTFMGLWLAQLFNGAVFVEAVFGWPGVGKLGVDSIMNRDYALMQGIVILIALNYMVANLVVDILYAYLDPRIRLGGQ